ncbi:hypothetical protein, partial [uncultured Oscillibacter sp.]|uniref:hypothetical protein n=1 Tax=uncultured Oscillibacter sp. TaxID=876091 RepID=UPI0025DF01AC
NFLSAPGPGWSQDTRRWLGCDVVRSDAGVTALNEAVGVAADKIPVAAVCQEGLVLNCLCSAAPVSGRQSDSEADLRIFQTGGNHLRQLGDTGSGISLGPERQLFKLVKPSMFVTSRQTERQPRR